MAETAVGLFENESSADAVVADLRSSSFPFEGIRKLAEPEWMPDVSATSRPSNEFETGLLRDMLSMRISEGQAEAYLGALRHGRVLVMATGSTAQADAAVDIMNDHDAIEVEELVTAPAFASPHDSDSLRRGVVAPHEATAGIDVAGGTLRGPDATGTHNVGTNTSDEYDGLSHDASTRIARGRAKKEGARVFTW